MTVTDYVARQTERLAEGLAHFIATTQEDKLDWRPCVGGETTTRSVYQQISECVVVNGFFAKLLRGEEVTPPAGGKMPELTFASPQDAQAQLIASGKELADAIRGLSEDDLARAYQGPRGAMLGENFILMGFRNMTYHAGQINFIQTLYGDTEFHIPPNWR